MGIGNDNWLSAKKAYIDKDKGCHIYYLTNACGQPHIDAKRFHKWPGREVISDDKTSAGMDRTDDIKKVYIRQLKWGSIILMSQIIRLLRFQIYHHIGMGVIM